MIFTSPWPSVAIPDTPYSDFIFAGTDAHADKAALIDGPTGRTLAYGQVRSAARRAAAGFARRGLRKGDRVAIVSPNLPEYPVAFHGIAMAGGVVTTANPLYSKEELAFQLNDSGARFLVTVPPFLDTVRLAAARARVEEIFVLGEAAGATPFAALLNNDGAPPAVAIDPRNDLLVLPYSSGTTGRAKGVMLTHRNVVAMHSIVAPLLDDLTRHTSLAVLPYFHAYGMTTMNGALLHGVTSVTMPRFVLEEYLSLIERYRVTVLSVVPPILLALARHPAVAQHDLSSIEHIGCGAAPLSASLQRQATERLKAQVRQGYGMTETTVGVSGWPSDPEINKPGAVGRLLPNMEARIVDPVSGENLGANQRGELVVRGPNVMRGYLNNEAATTAMLDADGWL